MRKDHFWQDFEAAVAADAGNAAREHLAAGRPIYYREDDTPAGHVIKHDPAGRRKLVRFVNGVERPANIDAADYPAAHRRAE